MGTELPSIHLPHRAPSGCRSCRNGALPKLLLAAVWCQHCDHRSRICHTPAAAAAVRALPSCAAPPQQGSLPLCLALEPNAQTPGGKLPPAFFRSWRGSSLALDILAGVLKAHMSDSEKQFTLILNGNLRPLLGNCSSHCNSPHNLLQIGLTIAR